MPRRLACRAVVNEGRSRHSKTETEASEGGQLLTFADSSFLILNSSFVSVSIARHGGNMLRIQTRKFVAKSALRTARRTGKSRERTHRVNHDQQRSRRILGAGSWCRLQLPRVNQRDQIKSLPMIIRNRLQTPIAFVELPLVLCYQIGSVLSKFSVMIIRYGSVHTLADAIRKIK